jgi:hypothetical protein
MSTSRGCVAYWRRKNLLSICVSYASRCFVRVEGFIRWCEFRNYM